MFRPQVPQPRILHPLCDSADLSVPEGTTGQLGFSGTRSSQVTCVGGLALETAVSTCGQPPRAGTCPSRLHGPNFTVCVSWPVHYTSDPRAVTGPVRRRPRGGYSTAKLNPQGGRGAWATRGQGACGHHGGPTGRLCPVRTCSFVTACWVEGGGAKLGKHPATVAQHETSVLRKETHSQL